MEGLHFYKYQATGNDFVMLKVDDNHQLAIWTQERIAAICHRQLGVGADGLIVLEPLMADDVLDFKMHYWNQDGSFASFCGNGGRAIVKFAKELGLQSKSGKEYRFEAGDGPHLGTVAPTGHVSVQMKNVNHWEWYGSDLLVNTGVPHRVHWLSEKETEWKSLGRKLRMEEKLQPEGANVTFIKSEGLNIHMDTYERGVEDITLSCGTGVVASVIASHLGKRTIEQGRFERKVITGAGMQLEVSYQFDTGTFSEIFLKGPVIPIFEGKWLQFLP